ncbi:hypothetical protein Bca52824_043229 [Brassica carinata]|uniref:Uncharacterized protein n=1 Tax=Brassica carinata TaxID=52824 RepID=A0A8X7S0S0_BRACI|nr:hypothetical protein Bca52824_043229 [Brassica carinata]
MGTILRRVPLQSNRYTSITAHPHANTLSIEKNNNKQTNLKIAEFVGDRRSSSSEIAKFAGDRQVRRRSRWSSSQFDLNFIS